MSLSHRVERIKRAWSERKRQRKGESLIKKYARFPRYTPTTLHWDGIELSAPDGISVAHQINEVLMLEKLRFDTPSNPIIYDCGANVGVVSIYFKKLFPQAKIIAFEADTKIASFLKENLRKNKVEDISVVEKAVWVDSKGVDFGSEGADAGSIHRTQEKTRVPSVRLRDYLASEKRIAMLKIDIEGAELEVLEDCRDALNGVERIFVEFHCEKSKPQKLDRMLSLLSENGFRYFIENTTVLKHPFIDIPKGPTDLQVNIYAYRRKN